MSILTFRGDVTNNDLVISNKDYEGKKFHGIWFGNKDGHCAGVITNTDKRNLKKLKKMVDLALGIKNDKK